MKLKMCRNCQKLTGHKRAIGFGTLVAILLTSGLWLVAISFYPKRCVASGLGGYDSLTLS